MSRARWRWRGSVAMLAVVIGLAAYPIAEQGPDVINSDWPAFATGAQMIVHDPGHLYDISAQRPVQLQVTEGRSLVTLGIQGILPFLAPADVALFAVPFDALGTELGGRLWVLFGLAALGLGALLAVRPRPARAALPVIAGVPAALLVLNAQLDGYVALGLGAAIALMSRPWLAGACLGLTLFKPHLVLPVGAGLLLARQWRVLGGWAVAGVALTAVPMIVDPAWPLQWLHGAGGTVQRGSREVALADFSPYISTPDTQTYVLALLTLVAMAAVLSLAWRCRNAPSQSLSLDSRGSWAQPRVIAVVIAGGVLAAPHALPTDLVLVGLALAVWGEASWRDWLLLSAGALVTGVVPTSILVPPLPALVGVLVVGWLLLRIAGVSAWRRGPQPASAG